MARGTMTYAGETIRYALHQVGDAAIYRVAVRGERGAAFDAGHVMLSPVGWLIVRGGVACGQTFADRHGAARWLIRDAIDARTAAGAGPIVAAMGDGAAPFPEGWE